MATKRKKRAAKKAARGGRGAELTLTPAFFAQHREAIENGVRAKLRTWGAHGWSVVGKAPALRLEVSVPVTLQRPARPVGPIRVVGRLIKPSVRATHAHMRRGRAHDFTAFGSKLENAVAPGARVRVGRGAAQEFIGIAAVLTVDGRRAILTCGHASAFGVSDEILAGAEADGEAIATLHTNFLEGPEPLDAALCVLTQAGVELLAQSSDAPTWQFQTVHAPTATDNDRTAVFWDTHDESDAAPSSRVHTFHGETSALFGPQGPRRGFIETGHVVVPGDSGSLLSLDDQLYGLCSGFVGFTAFFTPIHSAIDRIQREGSACSVFRPANA